MENLIVKNDITELVKKILDSDATTQDKIIVLKALNDSVKELNQILKNLNHAIKEEAKDR